MGDRWRSRACSELKLWLSEHVLKIEEINVKFKSEIEGCPD